MTLPVRLGLPIFLLRSYLLSKASGIHSAIFIFSFNFSVPVADHEKCLLTVFDENHHLFGITKYCHSQEKQKFTFVGKAFIAAPCKQCLIRPEFFLHKWSLLWGVFYAISSHSCNFLIVS